MTEKIGSDQFIYRHLGLKENDANYMLRKLGFNDLDEFINQVIPKDIQVKNQSSEYLPKGQIN